MASQLSAVQTWNFTRVYQTNNAGGGPTGTWNVSTELFDVGGGALVTNGYSSGGASYSSGAILPDDTVLGSLIADSHTYLWFQPSTGLPIQIVATNIDAGVEGYPYNIGPNYNCSQGGWYRNGTYWVLAGLSLSKRLVMLGSTDGGNTWVEYDAANCPGAIPFSWFDFYLQPGCRPSSDRNYCDVVFNVGSTNQIALNTFNFNSKTWSGNYGTITLSGLVDFKPGNNIVRYGNGDLGVFYTYTPTGTPSQSTLVYREWTGSSWGSEITILTSTTALPWWANFAIDPGGELVHCFIYKNTWDFYPGYKLAYWTVAHGGTVVADIFDFPDATNPDGSDGANHPLAFNGNIYIPYDDFVDKKNSVWVCPIGGSTFTKQFLPVPTAEIGLNPSCAFMVQLGSSSALPYAWARISPHKGRALAA